MSLRYTQVSLQFSRSVIDGEKLVVVLFPLIGASTVLMLPRMTLMTRVLTPTQILQLQVTTFTLQAHSNIPNIIKHSQPQQQRSIYKQLIVGNGTDTRYRVVVIPMCLRRER